MNRQTVFLTGATKGLGRSIALETVRRGHRLIGLYSQDESAAELLRNELISAQAHDSLILKQDVNSMDSTFLTRFEWNPDAPITLINNAWPHFSPTPFHLLRWEDASLAWDRGVKGAWAMVQILLKPMLRCGQSTVVHVLTSALHPPMPKGFTAYLMAKSALVGLTGSLASEYHARGLRAFSISPGFMDTAFTQKWDQRLTASIQEQHQAQAPAEVASALWNHIENPSTPGQGEDYLITPPLA